MEKKLKCNVCSCVYNIDNLCSAAEVQILPAQSEEQPTVYCSTYLMRDSSEIIQLTNVNILGGMVQLFNDGPSMFPQVNCYVYNCIYNEKQSCKAEELIIESLGLSSTEINNCAFYKPLK